MHEVSINGKPHILTDEQIRTWIDTFARRGYIDTCHGCDNVELLYTCPDCGCRRCGRCLDDYGYCAECRIEQKS